jgi:hypothetical protein
MATPNPAAAPTQADVPLPSPTGRATTAPSSITAGVTSSPSEEPIAAFCKRLQPLPESAASVKLNLERICGEATGAGTTPPDEIIEELCVQLASASPLSDQQALVGCRTG